METSHRSIFQARMKGWARLRKRGADSPDVAVGISDGDVAPTVRVVGGWLEDGGLSGSGASVNGIGINAEDAEFSARPPKAGSLESSIKCVVVVGVIGVQHEIEAEQMQSCKIRIGVAHGSAENIAVERERLRDIAHQQVDREFR